MSLFFYNHTYLYYCVISMQIFLQSLYLLSREQIAQSIFPVASSWSILARTQRYTMYKTRPNKIDKPLDIARIGTQFFQN